MTDLRANIPDDFGHSHRSLFKQLSFLTKNSLLGAAASYFLTLTLAKHLGPSEFGLYSHVMIIGTISSVIVNFCTDNTAPVLYAESRNEVKVINGVYSIRLLFFLIVLLFLFPAYLSQPIAGIGILAITIASLNFGFLYEVTGRNISYSYIFLFERLFYVATVFYLIFVGLANIASVFTSLLFFTIASFAWQFYRNKNVALKFKFLDPHKLIGIIKSNALLVLISFSTYAYGGFSRLILEKKFGLEELGIYSAGWQITMAITIFQAQVFRVWRTKISTALIDRDVARLKIHLTHYLLYATLPITGLALLVYLTTPEMVRLWFGVRYSLLLDLIPIFCCYFPIISMDGLSTILWVGIGNRVEYLSISILMSLILITSLFIIPAHMGLIGIATLVVGTHGISVIVLLLRFYLKYITPLKKHLN